ncbi:hypothetical protein [Caulobacter sp. BK020]|uniref:hypothetical protein n=1 Tax=Caulobacter sp. BK020 TaxID=2512117 RepID=UPI001045D2FC|nr:hypothetical protein [Caulobacter sp. BK020]TCS13289.1 hypothetical protein EV278_110158 [Caulobacter sp. BK020]
MSNKLTANIERIAAYTAEHAELLAAHHFLYDLRQPPSGTPRFVVMGVNPGETPYDWKISPKPTEETSRFDFHVALGGGRSAIRWSKAAKYFLDDSDYVLAELFFWSSRDSRAFNERFGRLATSKHLPLCVGMNRDLIDHYQPRAVVLPGLTNMPLVRKLYELTPLNVVKYQAARVAEHYTDGKRPWVFTKHWTAAFGFSKVQRELAREAVRAATI